MGKAAAVVIAFFVWAPLAVIGFVLTPHQQPRHHRASTVIRNSEPNDDNEINSSNNGLMVRQQQLEPRHDNLSWRLDPSKSFSDWTIQITCKSSGSSASKKSSSDTNNIIDTYNVHRAVLAYGPRRTSYFESLFASDSTAASPEKITRIELEETETQAFPMLLDYVYQGSTNFDAKTAVALYNLGEFFGVRGLCKDVLDFIETTFSNDHQECDKVIGRLFYEQAKSSNCKVILDLFAVLLVEKMVNMSSDWTQAQLLFMLSCDLDWWMNSVMRKIPEDSGVQGVLASLTTYEVLHGRPTHEIKKDLFRKMTSVDLLPDLGDDQTALGLLEVEQRVDPLPGSSYELTELQSRCIDKMYEFGWGCLAAGDVDRLKGLSSNVIVEIIKAKGAFQ
jgi:hypothetical protein